MTAASFHALVPAAGRGERLGGDRPKQYLRLAGATVLEHTLAALSAHPSVVDITVVVAHDDQRFDRLDFSGLCPVERVVGGGTRAQSVLNGLRHIKARDPDGWVMVHDAARPCLPPDCLDRLVAATLSSEGGALLALPLRDTIKRADAQGCSQETVDRSGLWAAQTPQAFRLDHLLPAMETAINSGMSPTDEAGAMERAGHRPALVIGSPVNRKLTDPGDQEWVEAWLKKHRAGAKAS